MTRGVIAAPSIIRTNANSFTMERTLSPQEIRYYMLYWDKVIIPTNNIMHGGLPDEDILIQSGVLERPKVVFKNHGMINFDDTLGRVQAIIGEEMMTEESNTDWVLHQIGNKLNLPAEYLEQKNSLRFELVNLLPVPNEATPIVDILEFKERRKSELNALHESVESVYLKALMCPDASLAASKAIRELKENIANLGVVSNEKWQGTSKFDFAIEFNLDGGNIAKGIAAGAVFDFYTNSYTLPLGQIAGGILSTLKFSAAKKSSFKAAANNSKLAYLSHAYDEKIV